MGINFTPEQIKNITKDIILIPYIIDNPEEGTGLIQQKEKIIAAQDAAWEADNNLKPFMELWARIVSAYHIEYHLLTGLQRTNYDTANIDEGARETGLHWPRDPIWTSLIAKVLPSNNGLPETLTSDASEGDRLNGVLGQIALLRNGFSDGSFNRNETIGGTSFSMDWDHTGLALGDRLIISGGGNLAYAQVISYTPGQAPDPDAIPPIQEVDIQVQISIIGGTLPTGYVNIKNYSGGFSNSERGYQTSMSSDRLATMNTFINLLNDSLDELESSNLTQIDTLENNEDPGNRGQQNLTEIDNLDNSIDAFINWRAITIVSPTGRYTDSGLGVLEGRISERETELTNRIAEVEESLGNVIQDQNSGDVSGEGAYLSYWQFIDLRISRGTGSLNQYYAYDIGIELFDKRIANANLQLDEYTQIFALMRIKEDTEESQDEFDVDDVGNFEVGHDVMVMDNDSVIYNRTIDSIEGTLVTLDSPIPSVLEANKLARIVRVHIIWTLFIEALIFIHLK